MTPSRPTALRYLDKPVAGLLLLALATIAIYLPGLRGGFTFDDYSSIVGNPMVHVSGGAGWREWLAAAMSSQASQLRRPLAALSFAANHALTGLDPYWMKATNLAIHLLNAMLAFLLARQLFRADGRLPDAAASRAALWVAAFWTLCAINAMPVLYVVQRMESLSHVFVFAGLSLYLSGRSRLMEDGRGWGRIFAGLCGGTLGGLLAKESAVLLPLYGLAIEWALLRGRTARRATDPRLVALYGVVLVLPALLGLAWLLPGLVSGAAYGDRPFTLAQRLLTEARVLVDYLRWTVLPDPSAMSLYHDDYRISTGLFSPPSTFAALLLLVALPGAAIVARRRFPLAALGLLLFLAAHALTGTIIPLDIAYEHRNYFASFGVALVLADLLLVREPGAPRPRLLAGVAVLLLLLQAGATSLRAREWDNPLRFSLMEAAKHPASPRATYEVARNYVILTDFDPASPYVDQAFASLDRAMHVPGAGPLPESAAILLASRLHRAPDPAWWATLDDKLARRPIGPQEIGALATLRNCQVRGECQLPRDEMVEAFLAALSNGNRPEILSLYASYALEVLHDPPLALTLWKDAADQAPRVAAYQAAVAEQLRAAGRANEAAPYLDRIEKLGWLAR